MKLRTIIPALAALFAVGSMHASGLEDLKKVENWKNPANGIWRAELGDMKGELRYSDLAADKPKIEAINKLTPAKFPFKAGEIQYMVTNDHKIMVRIPCSPGEKLYGFGLQLDGLKKSRTVMTLNMDHWGKGGGKTHAPVPFYISSKGYGVFFNTARFIKIYNQIGNRKDSPNNPKEVDRNPVPEDKAKQPGPWLPVPPGDAVEASIHGKGMEIMVFAGNSMLEVVQRYNLFNGGGALPPLWGLGFWHRVHAHFSADQTRAEVKEFSKRDFPLEVIGLEPGWMNQSYPCTYEWQTKRFPDPAAFTKELLDQGIRLNLWENPYISKKSKLYKEMYPLSGSHTVWLGIVPDYTLPKARKLLTDQHYKDHISIGISGYKIDEVDGFDFWLWPDHATFPSGISGESMRQAYGLLMQNMLYQDLFKKRNVRTYSQVRGSNGSASGYPFVLYSDSYRHSQYITGMSTSSLSGILWAPEIRNASNGREWLNRMQTVCFSPLAQLNAWSTGRKPWSFNDVTEPVRDVIKLRMRLLPYLYTAFADYHYKGIPAIRAMILEDGASDAEDKVIKGKLDSEKNPYAMGKIIEKTDQFMFGKSIMVAPFYEQLALKRAVRLPAGNWYDFYTGKFVGNNKTIIVTAKALKNRMPLFVKEGAVIPMLSENVNNTKAAYGHELILRHYGKKAGSFSLYEDDGKSFDYDKGKFRIRQLNVDKNGKLTESITTDNAPAMFGKIKSVKQMTN